MEGDSIIISTLNEVDNIEVAFKKALSRPKDILKNLATYNANLYPYTDEESNKRVIDTCISLLEVNKKKFLNFKLQKSLYCFILTSYQSTYVSKF